MTLRNLKLSKGDKLPYRLTVERADLTFSAAHFLLKHEKCARLHGHNYKVRVEVASDLLDGKHMVIDFFSIRELARKACEPLDHRVLIPAKSNEISIKECENEVEVVLTDRRYVFPRSDVALLPLEATTVEKIAEYLYAKIREKLPEGFNLKVSVEEAEGAIATFEL
ncbi:MAG: 6-pyruvoyl trahydropterin synthase family protein [Candidatus Freyarchaeota archaeon]